MSLILHLSDLHLGPVRNDDIPDEFKSDIPPLTERTTRYTTLKETLTQLVPQLKAQSKQLDAVVISGDITVANDEKGFQALDEVLKCLNGGAPFPAEKTVIVPGNHDVEWGLTGNPAGKYGLFKQYIRDKGFKTPLLEGIDLVDGTIVSRDLTRHYLLDSERQWAIVPINSSHYCGSLEPIAAITESVWNDLPRAIATTNAPLKDKEEQIRLELRRLRLRDVARISIPGQVNAIRQLVSAIRLETAASSRSPVLIGVLHHHLLPVSAREEFKPFESITNLGLLRYVLRDNGFSVILHGHKHTDYVYFDHVHGVTAGDVTCPHRILVISAPSVEAPGTRPRNVCRLIEIPDRPNAPSVSITDLPSTEAGTQLRLPDPHWFRLWQPTSEGAFHLSPINIVEGDSVDEVYERALALFRGASRSTLVPNVICRVARPSDPVSLPEAYPDVPDIAELDRPAWFKRIVEWWQKRAFRRLSGDHHFNHGSRIHWYDRKVNQLDRVIEAIQKDRGTSRGVITLGAAQK